MMPAPAVADIACALFGAGMLHALATDLRHRRICNGLVAALAALWLPAAMAAGIPGHEMAAALATAALVFAGGLACFSAGWLGGGDVKLAAVAVLWLGAGQAMPFLLLSSVLGALLTGIVLLARRCGGAQPTGRTCEVPYGPALAVAGIALLHGSPWATGL